MYRHFYGLREKPFNMTPDPKFLYLGSKHKEAFAHLFYGIKNRNGFVVITGEVGTGKTTLCRALLKQIGEDTEVAVLFNPCLSPDELLMAVNADLGIPKTETAGGMPPSRRDLLDDLSGYLIQKRSENKNVVLIIDESQLLSPEVLEHIRLLSNYETDTEKLIQIVLVGQPELQAHLSLPKLRQLDQRVTARYYLPPLNAKETGEYVLHRLRKAGASKKIFTKKALDLVYKCTEGIPRQINVLCERALLAGYAAEQGDIDKALVKKAWRALQESKVNLAKGSKATKRLTPAFIAATVLALAAFGACGWYLGQAAKGIPEMNQAGPAIETVAETAVKSPDIVLEEVSAPPEEASLVDPPIKEPMIVAKADDAAPMAPQIDAPVSVDDNSATQAPVETGDITIKPGLGREEIREALVKETRLEQRARVAKILLESWGCDASKLEEGTNGIKYAGDFFRVAREAGLRCMKDGMNLTRLKSYNLPFVLELRISGQFGTETRYLAVTKMEGGKCLETSLEMEDGDYFEFDGISDLWLGRAYVFWKDYEDLGVLLTMGSTGVEVKRLQTLLKKAGYHQGDIRPIFGPSTRKSVVAFQRDHRLAQDGVVGDNTQIALYGLAKEYEFPKVWVEAKTAKTELPDALSVPAGTETITIGRGDDIR
ncbi:AAA family ATPase [Candidatus Hydrogenedentota bacterium]